MNNQTLEYNNEKIRVTQELENLRNANHLYSTNAEIIEKKYNDLKEKSKKKFLYFRIYENYILNIIKSYLS